MQPSFLICEFAKATLSNLVKECFGSDFPDIIKKKQVNYIYNYLSELGATTVLLEPDYVDRDYLEDYSRYYVKCFNRYGERCARMHFFKKDIDHNYISSIFSGVDSEKLIASLQDSYLGFMVIKPLPKTFIGKTCLSLYPRLEKDNRGIIKKTYNVNLFGIDLSVESVPFQEQDKVISACATTSIWSALHGLNSNSNGYIPSSSEITLAAINHIVDSSNSFPNKGLTNKQILRALDTQRLRNHQVNIVEFDDDAMTSSFRIIKSYVDSGIPIILGSNVYSKDSVEGDDSKVKLRLRGGHAVTVLGYKDDGEDRILYLHDDRLGPYARASYGKVDCIFPSLSDEVEKQLKSTYCISLQEKSEDGKWLSVEQILVPDSLIIPNYRKVRISAESIDNTCKSILDEFNAFLAEMGQSEDKFQLSFTIKLDRLADIRTRILADSRVQNKEKILTKSAARFLWVATFSLNNKVALEILFDSTDIPQGSAVSNIIKYDDQNSELILAPFYRLLESDDVPLPDATEHSFFTAFVLYLEQKEAGLWEYLNSCFGEPRAPKRLKEEEVQQHKLQKQTDVLAYYGRQDKELCDDFSHLNEDDNDFMIWAISLDGALLIGKEVDGKGHPTLTGFKFARIAGELRRDKSGWYINSKSGRYSTDYDNANDLLANVKRKFLEIYSSQEENNLRVEPYEPA